MTRIIIIYESVSFVFFLPLHFHYRSVETHGVRLFFILWHHAFTPNMGDTRNTTGDARIKETHA